MSQILAFNGFKIKLSADEFSAYVRPVMDTKEFKTLRELLKNEWFLYLRDGIAYGFPRTQNPTISFGELTVLTSADNLWFLKARLEDVLPAQFPHYQPTHLKPFRFVGQKNEIVETVIKKMSQVHPLVSSFKIRPKFELDAKLIEPNSEEFYIALFIQTGTRWEIESSLVDLKKAGINLSGLYVIHKNPLHGQPRLVGRIERLHENKVILSEAYSENSTVDVGDVYLEGNKASFARCLKVLLGSAYNFFDDRRERETAKLTVGEEYDKVVRTMHEFLQKKSPIKLTEELSCEIGERVVIKNSNRYQSIYAAPQVQHCFDAARTKTHIYPWKGIESFGPFSRDTFEKKSPKILVIFPDTVQSKVENFLRLLEEGVNLHSSSNESESIASAYQGGFARLFSLTNVEFELKKIPWLGQSISSPAQHYRDFLEDYLRQMSDKNKPDAAIVVLLEELAKLPAAESPYLQTKALLLMSGIPVQEIRSTTLLQSNWDLQYTLQNFSLALYAKLNGTPWTVNHDLTINDELVIGMGACELSNSRFHKNQRFIGITTVFRGDGSYLLSNLSEECSYEKYPDVLKKSALRILKDIKDRNGWRPKDTVRVVFHAYKPLKDIEIAEIMRECVVTVGAEQQTEFAFLNIVNGHTFDLFDFNQPGKKMKNGKVKGKYVPERGKIVQIGRFTRLLTTKGASLIKRDVTPLPTPLLVNIHPSSTYRSLDYLTEQVLKFTSLSWRSTNPAPAPVTIYYSELIAEQLARLKAVEGWSPLLLNSKLRSSRWFL